MIYIDSNRYFFALKLIFIESLVYKIISTRLAVTLVIYQAGEMKTSSEINTRRV